MIKIKISQRTNETCLKALKATLELYSGNARPLIEILKNGFAQPADFNDDAVEEFNSYLKTKELADDSKLKKVLEKIGDNLGGEKDLTFDGLTLICNNLELMNYPPLNRRFRGGFLLSRGWSTQPLHPSTGLPLKSG